MNTKNVGLLDCTLRDGGYVNDWQFGHATITGIYKNLDKAKVDYVEIGYLKSGEPFDMNRAVYPSIDAINKIMSNVEKEYSVPVAMIDLGNFNIADLTPQSEAFINGIRLTFKKGNLEKAAAACRDIKSKGYKLFVQILSITGYSVDELMVLIREMNDIKPFAVSIIDTYGLLDEKMLSYYFAIIDNNLNKDIKIGFHDHNNFQLGFSNTAKFMEMNTNRDLVGDASIYGMGKSAGNTPSELLAMHLNNYFGKDYDLTKLLEIVNTYLLPIHQLTYWGYKYDYYISAMQNCHPNYVKYLLDKNTLSVSSVNEILANIPEAKKLSYSKDYIEDAYLRYQSKEISDMNYVTLLKEELSNDSIVVIGPGSSINKETAEIKKKIENQKAKVISVNFRPSDFPVDYVFVSNSKRYNSYEDGYLDTENSKLIITSNITPLVLTPDAIVNYESILFFENNQCRDNALLMLLNLLIKLGCTQVYLAGFDGYDIGGNNYFSTEYEFASTNKVNMERNVQISSALRSLSTQIGINFITKSLYKIEE